MVGRLVGTLVGDFATGGLVGTLVGDLVTGFLVGGFVVRTVGDKMAGLKIMTDGPASLRS